jgi:hypothetical protein
MEQSFKSTLKVFYLPLYENYPANIDPAKLYKYIEINLYDCWITKKLTVSKKKRYKPINFKKLYKKLSVLKKQYQKPRPFNWINTVDSQNFSKNSLNISITSSYLLRALNNSQLYKHQQIPHYKSIYLKGFTFEKEKVANKKKRGLNDPLFFFYCSELDKKILRQQEIEKKFFD